VLRVGSGTLEFPASDVARIQSVPSTREEDAQNRSPRVMPGTPNDVLADAARAEGLPVELVWSVARIESGYEQKAVSPRGAIGLMQLMPGTAAGLGVDPNLAAENAHGGAMYLRSLLLRYHGDSALALAAYNAGPGAVKRFGGVPPYEETRRYVLRVLKEYGRLHNLESKPADTARTSTPSATN
jgi:soluble lytic murein transglycosylase-like protein